MSERFGNLRLPDSWQDRYNQLWYAKHAIRYGVSGLAALVLVIGAAFFNAGAWESNVLQNGDFESGFHLESCGMVGNNWHCFTNGGGANYGFYDEQWAPVISGGAHGQLIEINTKGIGAPDPDRYAGIYQTMHVTDWADYKLSLKGMIRTTNHSGDPWRYRVQVGWTQGAYADWTKVDNWTDIGWDTYYDRVEPGAMSEYSTMLTAMDDYMTIYIRFWKKWGNVDEEILLNLDDISLMGASYGTYDAAPVPVVEPTPVPPVVHKPVHPQPVHPQPVHPQPVQPQPVHPQPAPPQQSVVCGGDELIYNGGFEHGFNFVGIGHVGKGWGSFTNGGAAGYGFYDEQWTPVVAEGVHGQLIEINAKEHNPADADRYAGIYQRLTGLTPGATYELSLKGMLRGAGNDPDPHRFEAQWGHNSGHDTDWRNVDNWTSMNLGTIHERTEPGAMAAYTVRFTAGSDNLVFFIRGWKKWGIYGVEMDMNLDAISLHKCSTGQVQHPPKPYHPPHPKPYHPAPKPVATPAPVVHNTCTYVVQPGDSLGVIAQNHWVSVDDLAAANGIYNVNVVYIGQKLHIPGCSAAAPVAKPIVHKPVVHKPVVHKPVVHKPVVHKPVATAPAYRTHVVKPGETLSGICLAYGIDHDALVHYNNIVNPNWIYVGQVLKLP